MIKKVINFVLNLIMSVLVLILICITFISDTVFNKDFVIRKLKENKFYERTFADIKEGFENYTFQSGLELEILDNLITEEMVNKDINARIDYIYSGEKVEIETNSIKIELDSRINNVLKENHRTPTEYEQSSINKYEDAIADCYENGIMYGVDFSINNIKTDYLIKAKNICIIAIIIISIVLLIVNKSILKYITFIGINLLFSGSLCVSVKYLLEKRVIHILLLDSKFSNFLISSLTEIIDKFNKNGIKFVVIGIILIVIGSFEKNKKTIENKNN